MVVKMMIVVKMIFIFFNQTSNQFIQSKFERLYFWETELSFV